MSESIYNLVPREYVPPVKQPFFKSQHNPDATFPGSTFGCHGTTRLLGAGKVTRRSGSDFGPREGEPKSTSPNSSLRLSGEQSVQPSEYKFREKTRGPVPRRDERPVYGITTSKNFITANAVEAILQAPRTVEKVEYDFMKKKEYGKVPAYLAQAKEEVRREQEMVQRYVKEQMGEIDEEPEQFEEMSEVERADLIEALKAKWDKVNAQYQKITHLVRLDTTGQMRRKERLETELKTLENDIEKLRRSGPILIR